MATELMSLVDFNERCKTGEWYDCCWVQCAIVRIVRNATGNLTYPACGSCLRDSSSAIKALDFSRNTSQQCCNPPVASHRWHFQVALMDKTNSDVPINRLPLFTVWQAADHLFGTSPLEAFRLSSEDQHEFVRSRLFGQMWSLEIGLNCKNQERTVWTASKPGMSHLYIDNPSIEGLRRQFADTGIEELRDNCREVRSAIDTVADNLTAIESLIQ
ncbi:hypothetical protein R1sor_020671 [Riccia sorocarpa]|uniref:Uncharacterized protein n=1 Tax=Riccia sorocarpa TaxID=122646 RepID=A0ABD3GEU5_9MARC